MRKCLFLWFCGSIWLNRFYTVIDDRKFWELINNWFWLLFLLWSVKNGLGLVWSELWMKVDVYPYQFPIKMSLFCGWFTGVLIKMKAIFFGCYLFILITVMLNCRWYTVCNLFYYFPCERVIFFLEIRWFGCNDCLLDFSDTSVMGILLTFFLLFIILASWESAWRMWRRFGFSYQKFEWASFSICWKFQRSCS
jgi:hypothetical protein